MQNLEGDSAGSGLSDWLLDLPERLRVAIEVVNQNLVPVLPASTEAFSILRHVVATDQSLRASIAEVLPSDGSQSALDDRLQTICFALPTRGALIVGRQLADDDSPEDVLSELDAIVSWLLEPVESALTKPANVI